MHHDRHEREALSVPTASALDRRRKAGLPGRREQHARITQGDLGSRLLTFKQDQQSSPRPACRISSALSIYLYALSDELTVVTIRPDQGWNALDLSAVFC